MLACFFGGPYIYKEPMNLIDNDLGASGSLEGVGLGIPTAGLAKQGLNFPRLRCFFRYPCSTP